MTGRNRPEAVALSLPFGNEVSVAPSDGGAVVSLSDPAGGKMLEIEISVTASGARIRARATSLEVEVKESVVARCERFEVHAHSAIALHSERDITIEAGRDLNMDASIGGVRVRANDDVQLLGERVLLNTDPPVPVPSWSGVQLPTESVVPREDVSGSEALATLVQTRR